MRKKWGLKMEKEINCDTEISGKYKHFKGKCYEVYCVACGDRGEKYVLYQQCYGDESFWIRPYEMFFQTVILDDGSTTQRFTRTTKQKLKTVNKIRKLIDLKLLKAYCEREKRLKAFFSLKWVSGFLTVISFISSFCIFKFQATSPWFLGAVTIISFVFTVFMITRSPKVFCTFEKIDIEEILPKK